MAAFLKILLLVALCSPHLSAQETVGQVNSPAESIPLPQVFFERENDPPLLGDRVVLVIQLNLPLGYELKVPNRFAHLPSAELIKEEVTLSRSLGEDGLNTRFELRLPYRILGTGWIIFPAMDLPLERPSGGDGLLTLPRRKFHTGTWFPHESNPQPSSPQASVPMSETNWLFIWFLVFLALLLLAFGVILGLNHWQRLRRQALPPPPVPPRMAALNRLARLEESNLLLEARLAEYYTELSETLREYLGGHWGFDSMDLTTTELRMSLRKLKVDAAVLEQVLPMLADFDLVKFAKFQPELIQARKDLQQVRELVLATARDESQGQADSHLPEKKEKGR